MVKNSDGSCFEGFAIRCLQLRISGFKEYLGDQAGAISRNRNTRKDGKTIIKSF